MNLLASLHTFWKFALVLFVALSTAACAQSGNQERIARATTGITLTGQPTPATGACNVPAGAIGRVFDDANTAGAGNFESRVKGLISANYDPQYIGSVEGINGASATCVTLEGALKFDSSGQLVLDKSIVQMKIYDSFADKLDTTGNPAGAYPINFVGAQSGRREVDGTFTVTFSDNFGSLTVKGRLTNSQVHGVIEYSNTKSFNGGSSVSGVLGAFAINTSSFIQ